MATNGKVTRLETGRTIGAPSNWTIAARRAGTHALIIWPPIFVAWVVGIGLSKHAAALDFMRTYVPAARAVVRGISPYGHIWSGEAFVYPPIAAYLVAPFTLLPPLATELIVSVGAVAVILAIIWLLGVRDWRCYMLPFLWPSTFMAIQSVNVILIVALLCAVAWHWRDRDLVSGLAVGAAIALKLIAWPLVLFLLITKRWRAAAAAAVAAIMLVLPPWAGIGFAGLARYPHMLLALDRFERVDGYTLGAFVAPFVGWPAAQALTYLVGAALAGLMIYRRRDEPAAFVIAIALVLALSPLAWMNYFVLLLLAVPFASARLSPIWIAPLALWVAPTAGQHGGGGNGTSWQTAAVLLITFSVLAFAAVTDAEPADTVPITAEGSRSAQRGDAEAVRFASTRTLN